MYLYKFQEKLNRDNIINRQTIEYLYSKNRCPKGMIDDYDLIYKVASEVFDPAQFEIQLCIKMVSKYDKNNKQSNDFLSKINTKDVYKFFKEYANKKFNLEFSLNLVIKYNDITITNSKDQSLQLKDLYVVLYFEHENGISLVDMMGFRTTYNSAEVMNGYVHSHLPEITIATGEYSSIHFLHPCHFCFGAEDVYMLFTRLNAKNNFNPELLKLMLFQIEPYLSWESLEGVPFKYIKGVFLKGNELNATTINFMSLLSNSDTFSKLIADESISYAFDLATSTYRIVENDEYEKFLVKKFPDFTHIQGANKKLYSKDFAMIQTDIVEQKNKFATSFQGRELQFKITDQTKINKPILIMHPIAKSMITKVFNAKINIKLFKYYGRQKRVQKGVQTPIG